MREPKPKATSGISEFARRSPAAAPPPQEPQRKRGRAERVGLTLRVSRAQWEKLHHFAVQRGVSINELCLTGLDKIFAEAGLSFND